MSRSFGEISGRSALLPPPSQVTLRASRATTSQQFLDSKISAAGSRAWARALQRGGPADSLPVSGLGAWGWAWEQGTKATVDFQGLCRARLLVLSLGFTGTEGRSEGKRLGIRHPEREGRRESRDRTDTETHRASMRGVEGGGREARRETEEEKHRPRGIQRRPRLPHIHMGKHAHGHLEDEGTRTHQRTTIDTRTHARTRIHTHALSERDRGCGLGLAAP